MQGMPDSMKRPVSGVAHARVRRQDCEDPDKFVAEVLMEQLEAARFILFSRSFSRSFSPTDSRLASFLRTVNPDAHWHESLLHWPFTSAILTDVIIGFNAKFPRSADPLATLLEQRKAERASWLQYVHPSKTLASLESSERVDSWMEPTRCRDVCLDNRHLGFNIAPFCFA
jgi:hypothetical protein